MKDGISRRGFLGASLVAVGALALSGCGEQEEPAKAPDLTGSWVAEGADGAQGMTAKIDAGTISIDWDSGDGTAATYWIGSFTAPTTAAEPYTWTSKRDADAMGAALLGSQDDTKDFTYQDGGISFSASAFGVTQTVTLHRA